MILNYIKSTLYIWHAILIIKMIFLNNQYLRLLIFLLIGQTSVSQQTYQYEWFSADTRHLPQNSVKSITPDKYGYLWLATENGLVRYDGQNFKTFNSENIKGLSSNRMLLFTGNIKKDSIIIYNELSEILLIHNRTVKLIKSLKLPKKLLPALNASTHIIHPAIRYPQNNMPFAVSVKDNTYMFTQDSLLIYNSDYKLTAQKKYARDNTLRYFTCSGNLYLLNKKNEYTLFSENAGSFKKFGSVFTPGLKIFTNTITQQAFLYSDKKLFYLREVNGQLITELIFDNFDFYTNNITSIYYDNQNKVLFLGSTNKGLLVVKQNNFSHNTTDYPHHQGGDDVFYAMAKYAPDKIITATGEVFDINGKTEIKGFGKYTDNFMMVIDNNGDIWTKTDKTLYRLTKKSDFKEFTKWEFDNSISCLLKGIDGKIFMGINDLQNKKGIMYLIDPNLKNPAPVHFLNLRFFISSLLDIDGKTLWCGSWKGLYKIDLKTKKTEQVKGIQNAFVRSFYAPNINEIWIGTYNKGFYLYKNGKVTHMPKDRNDYLLTTHCIIEDSQGFMWMTTNKGIFAASKKDLLDYADNKLKQVYYQAYDKNAGFLNNEFNGGCSPCGVNLDNKVIFVPSMDGVVYFNPSKVQKREPKNDIFLDQIEIDSLSYSGSGKLVFDRNFGKIKFYLSSPFFGNPYNQNIETMLEGPVEQDWTHMTENNVSFSTLPPGEYKLQVRKLGGFGSQYIYKEYRFSITPAFWQTTRFKTLLIVLALFMVYLIYKLRVRYIKHKNILLEKQVVMRTQQLQTTVVALRKTKEDLSVQVNNHKSLIKTITHDIKSPLKFIAITGRYLYNNLEKSKPISKEDIQAIHTSSSQLFHFVDNFLEYAKETDLNSNESEPYLLNTLTSEKADFFKNIATAAKTTIHNTVDNKLLITVNRHLLSIILHNLLDNALKHTFGGTITIKALAEKNLLSISVADTGKGMSPELVDYYMSLYANRNNMPKPKGMGLHMIAELLAITGGALHITSEENKGTTVTISFTQND